MTVVTWNLRGPSFGERRWLLDVRRLFQTGADIVCLQSCPPPPRETLDAAPPRLLGAPGSLADLGASYVIWNVGTFRRPHYVLVYFVPTDGSGLRVDLAIAISFAPAAGDAPLAPAQLLYVPNAHERGRPAIGLRLPYNGLGLDVYTLDALAPHGADAAALLAAIQATDTRWFVAGAFARAASAWTDLPRDVAACPHNAATLHPGHGTALDYAFIRPGPPVHGNVLGHFLAADRYPVAYTL